MPLTGNGHGALTDLLRGLSELAEGSWRKEMNQALGAELIVLVKDGFRKSMDPYGKAWPRPKKRNGKPLLRTALLRNSWAWRAGTTAEQITITNSTSYAAYIQDGTSRMEARLMFPEADLPPHWAERLSAVADLAIRQHLPK